MVGVGPQMLNLLLAVEHLPALNAEDLAVALFLDLVKSVDECFPLGGVSLNHFGSGGSNGMELKG